VTPSSAAEIPARAASSLLPAYIAGGAIFMQAFESTAISTALPTLARSFGTLPVNMSLVISCYLIAATGAVPLSGWLADRLGARTALSLAVCVFALSSLACALSGSLGSMLTARVLQGAASAFLLPVGRVIALRSVRHDETVRAMAALTTPLVIGPVLGGPVGGFIATYLSWRWIFLINVPVCILFLYGIHRFIDPIPRLRRRLDWRGTGLVTVALLAFTTAIGAGPTALTGAQAAGLTTVGLAAATLYWQLSRGRAHPVLDLTLFELRTFAIICVGGMPGRAISRGGPFLLALLFQVGFGFSAVESGLYVLCTAIGSLVARSAMERFVAAIGFRALLIGNAGFVAITFAATALLSASSAHAVVVVLMLMQGFAFSIQMVSLSSLTFADIPGERAADASTLATILQQVAGNIGLGLVVLVLQLVQLGHDHALADTVDLKWTVVLISLLPLFSIPWFARLHPRAGGALVHAAVAVESQRARPRRPEKAA
jgi:EmrB/QacA subfamily drug resistance transporter